MNKIKRDLPKVIGVWSVALMSGCTSVVNDTPEK